MKATKKGDRKLSISRSTAHQYHRHFFSPPNQPLRRSRSSPGHEGREMTTFAMATTVSHTDPTTTTTTRGYTPTR